MALLQIPIAKGGKNCFFPIDTDIFQELTIEVQMEVLGGGFERLLNAGMSASAKFPAPTKLEGEALETAKANALAKAAKNFEDLKAGKIKVKYDQAKAKAKAPATVEDRQILSEAKRAAIQVLKNAAKARNIKPLAAVPASKWTELALKEIEANPKYIEDAKAAIAARALTISDLDLSTLIVLDPVLVAKAKAKSDKAKVDADQKSAKQAGLPKPHGKGKIPPARPKAPEIHATH
jgi:hypothetical protein